MFGVSRTLPRFAASTTSGGQRQWRVSGVAFLAGATATTLGVAAGAQSPKEGNTAAAWGHTVVTRSINHQIGSRRFSLMTMMPPSLMRTSCEAAVMEETGGGTLGEILMTEEEEKFLDTLNLYRRWFKEVKKQWEISSPASIKWPDNIPQKADISALEMDHQMYLKGHQADSRKCQDLEFRIASYYLFKEDSLEKQRKGFNMVKKLAVDGHPDGLCLYAMVWNHGGVAGMEAQPHLAVKYWRQAADAGHLASMYELAVALYMGDGTVEDPSQAVKYFIKAADLGHSGAAYLLADCYLDGVGVERNRAKALEWLMTAAEMGHRQAQRRAETLLMGTSTGNETGSSTTVLSTSTAQPVLPHLSHKRTTKLETERWRRACARPNSDWYREVSLERRFTIGGGSRNPLILFRRKSAVEESRQSAD